MARSTPSCNALLRELTDFPPNKVEVLSTALDVPRRVFQQSQINHPREARRWKADVVDWWVRNKEVSWEALAAALESEEVDERNIARQIRSRYGGLGNPKGIKLYQVWLFYKYCCKGVVGERDRERVRRRRV